jgi:protein phosphatase
MELFADTNVGRVRENNEDAYYVSTISEGLALLVVADGVGGHAFGEIASQTTVGIFKNLLQKGKLAAATDPTIREILLTMSAQKAHVEVSKMAVEDP